MAVARNGGVMKSRSENAAACGVMARGGNENAGVAKKSWRKWRLWHNGVMRKYQS